ncbi:hypothetical protein Aca07nite_64600 [Actinoplanes capillaceus]|uniref:DUF2269 domain-containing protein n=1 Tax=Actinoplanes campanulatus TaxID=113559 RepID=A0ABQ3WSN8_9ACTN|nr:DUF2269 domain-containing protein [Actinoplanes capillaceus]GID49185.1 hypothetical protein Aca07nite_64600 [Actinoplanes capillaceus]
MRKAALVAHVTTSVGWLGAVTVFLVLAVTALRSHDDTVLRAGYIAMEAATRYAIVPLALASLITGLVSSLGTSWGLIRHWWVLIKLALIVVATVVLLLQLAPIGALAAAAADGDPTDGQWSQARLSLVVHAAGGLLVLLAATVLAVYKPRGLTRYGFRRMAAATSR